MVCLDWGNVSYSNLMGEWDSIPHNIQGQPDPLIILLAHSDCEGLIKSEHCRLLADRIAALIPLLPSDPDGGHIGDWSEKSKRFVDGLRKAAEAGEDLEFH